MKYFKLLLACFAVMIVAYTVMAQNMNPNTEKLNMAEYAIKGYYVDSINETKLVEDAITGMLDKLDPHSTYSNAEETKELNEPLQGNFGGVGIQFNMKDDTLYVIQTVAGGPSEKLGIIAGDRIVEVNDTVIAGVKMKNTDIMKRLRGPKGTKVNVKVKRRGVPELIDFRITRDNIPLYSVDASYMVDDKTGYIRISRFANDTHKEFINAINKLKDAGMQQLILDLSDNGGGYLQAAVEMANEFLNRGENIVFTEGRNSPRYDANALGTGSLKKEKVVVIVNQYSASASEIFAGAIQDWDRGVIVGRRTFGKGLVQRPFPFRDGSMMRLTVARYYTPSGRSIQKPYDEGDKQAYEKDILNRFNKGEFMNADSIHFSDSLKYVTLKNKRKIYGGGGIMPDVFVPLDTTEYTDYYRDVVAKGVLNQFVIDYVDKNRTKLIGKYKDVEAFDKGFEVDNSLLENLKAQAEKEKVKFNEEQYAKSKDLISLIIKALIARDLYDTEAYFRVINHRNDMLKKALEIINNDKSYKDLLM